MWASFRAAADRLGLALWPPDPDAIASEAELRGERDGQPIRVRYLPGEGVLETEVHFAPPLDLGLEVRPARQGFTASSTNLSRVGRFFGRADLHVNEGDLADAFEAHGDEPARVRFVVEALRAPLAVLHRARVFFRVTDAMVCIHRPLHRASADAAVDLPIALHAASTIAALRRSVSPAEAVEAHVGVLRSFAGAHHFDFLTTPLCLRGEHRGRRVTARAARTSRDSFTMITDVGMRAGVYEGQEPRSFVVRTIEERQGPLGPFESQFTEEPPGAASLSNDAKQALMALASGHLPSGHLSSPARVELSQRGLCLSTTLGDDPYDLDGTLDLSEVVLAAVERGATPRRRDYR